MNAITRASASAFCTLQATAGVPITYKRYEDGRSFTLTAVPGRSSMVTDDQGVAILEGIAADFIVRLREIGSTTPSEGDTITHTVGDCTATYRVMSPPWTRSDHAGDRIRIHTKRVSNG